MDFASKFIAVSTFGGAFLYVLATYTCVSLYTHTHTHIYIYIRKMFICIYMHIDFCYLYVKYVKNKFE